MALQRSCFHVIYLCLVCEITCFEEENFSIFPFELNGVGNAFYRFWTPTEWSGNAFYVDIDYDGYGEPGYIWYHAVNGVGHRPILETDPIFTTTRDNKKYLLDRHIIYKHNTDATADGMLYFIAYDNFGYVIRIEIDLSKLVSDLHLASNEITSTPEYQFHSYRTVLFGTPKYSTLVPQGKLHQYYISTDGLFQARYISSTSMEIERKNYMRYMIYTFRQNDTLTGKGIISAEIAYENSNVPVIFSLGELDPSKSNHMGGLEKGEFGVRFATDNTFAFRQNKGGVVVCEALGGVLPKLKIVKGPLKTEIDFPSYLRTYKSFSRLEVVISDPESDTAGMFTCIAELDTQSKEVSAKFEYFKDVPFEFNKLKTKQPRNYGSRKKNYIFNITAVGSPVPEISCLERSKRLGMPDLETLPEDEFWSKDTLKENFNMHESVESTSRTYILVISNDYIRKSRRKNYSICIAKSRFDGLKFQELW